MSTVAQPGVPTLRKPLRVWPGVVLIVALGIARFGVKALVPGIGGFSRAMMWAFGVMVAILLWWLFFSRAPWSLRLGAFGLMLAGLGAAWGLKHDSMGPVSFIGYAVPWLFFALVASAVASGRMAEGPRRATVAAAILLACGLWTLVRTDGISGDHVATFGWRWAKSPEERLLAQADPAPAARPPAPTVDAPQTRPLPQAGDGPTALPSAPAAVLPSAPPAMLPTVPAAVKASAEWPGFRGPERDGIVHGVRIETNWSASPPVELWRRPVGPGWSSFAVGGNRLYTQEQRGEDEVVACYDAATGAPVWTHRDAARFFESNAGAGPRGTPTLSGGRVYTLGATGILNALDARDGAVVWTRSAASDTGAEVPTWGFSGSPLVVDDKLVVAVGGQLVAYDLASGAPRWFGPKGGGSYSSPHRLTLAGVPQVVLMSGAGTTSLAPADGTLLWKHKWPGIPIVQPALTEEGDVLIAASGESGTRRLAVAHGPGGWTTQEVWTSNGLKPYFNDFVVHHGHAFGFDARILACIDLKDGARKWKGGRFGNGQLVLLPDQDLLLVLSEEGELALVAATPDQFTEIARFPAIQGKTWNHPVLVGDVLLVRNAQEMVAFRLPRAGQQAALHSPAGGRP